MKIHFGHRVGKQTPSTELPRDFCAGIGPLQLGVVLVFTTFQVIQKTSSSDLRGSPGISPMLFVHTGCCDTFGPHPQPKPKVAQYNQTYCLKVKSISAMDFQYFYFVSIFTIFLILSNKNAQIHKNRTQSTLFICFFTTLYGFYGISVYWS